MAQVRISAQTATELHEIVQAWLIARDQGRIHLPEEEQEKAKRCLHHLETLPKIKNATVLYLSAEQLADYAGHLKIHDGEDWYVQVGDVHGPWRQVVIGVRPEEPAPVTEEEPVAV